MEKHMKQYRKYPNLQQSHSAAEELFIVRLDFLPRHGVVPWVP